MSKFYIFDNKAVINSQFSLINLSDHVFSELAPILGNRALIGVPFFHVYALMGAWIYLAHGGTVVIPSTIKADLIADLVEKESMIKILILPGS